MHRSTYEQYFPTNGTKWSADAVRALLRRWAMLTLFAEASDAAHAARAAGVLLEVFEEYFASTDRITLKIGERRVRVSAEAGASEVEVHCEGFPFELVPIGALFSRRPLPADASEVQSWARSLLGEFLPLLQRRA